MLELRRVDHGRKRLLDFFFVRRPVDVFERFLSELTDRVRRRIGASQRVQPQPSPIDHRLPQGPEKDRRVLKAVQHFGRVCRVRERDVLQDDEVRIDRIEKCVQLVDGKKHFLRHSRIVGQ